MSEWDVKALREEAGLRWVACSAKEFGPVGYERHLIPVGKQLNTLCGCSATHPEIWRGNTRKPKCKRCMEIEPKARRRN